MASATTTSSTPNSSLPTLHVPKRAKLLSYSLLHPETPLSSSTRSSNPTLLSASLYIFRGMIDSAKPIDSHTLPSVLKACAGLSAMEIGRQIHTLIGVNGLCFDLAHSNALIIKYAKCGVLADAIKDKMPERNEVSCSAMMARFGIHGKFGEVLELFERMVRKEWVDAACLTSVLSANSHGGLVQKGEEYFHITEERFGVRQWLEHYTCMVDMLGRGGRMEEAEELVMGWSARRMPHCGRHCLEDSWES